MQYENRRKVVPKRGIAQRFPRTSVFMGTMLGLCIIFSKPLYDIIFYKPPKDLKEVTLGDQGQ